MLAYAREHKPDLNVHTGDLFDAVRPAYPEMARGVNALQELAVAAPVVVLCGNHDSPALFDLFGQLIGPAFTGSLHQPGAATCSGRHIVVPHGGRRSYPPRAAPVRARQPDARRFRGARNWRRYTPTGSTAANRAWTGISRRLRQPPDVAVLRSSVRWQGRALRQPAQDPGRRELRHPARAPAWCDIRRVRRIHKPQKLPGGLVDGCYAGSPIQLDFGELGEAKRIVLVEARPGQPPHVQSPFPLSGGHQLWRFEGTVGALAEAAPSVGRVLALLTIQSPSTIADIRTRVQDLLPDAVVLDVYPVAADRQLGVTVATAPSRQEQGIEVPRRDYLAGPRTRGAAAQSPT